MIVQAPIIPDNQEEEKLDELGDDLENLQGEGNVAASQVSVEGKLFQFISAGLERKELINKNKSKLEKLLCQPDIFDCLRRINNGEIKSYDELEAQNPSFQGGRAQGQYDAQSRRRIQLNKNDEMEELNTDNNDKLFEILKIEQQPENLVGGVLRDYQIEGLNWLYKLYQANLNGILADEMGLGKTIQSISIITLVENLKTEAERMNRHSHHIIIVPKIVLGKWKKEITDWIPTLRLFQFYGSNEEREQQKMEIRQHNFDILLTTFETVIREKAELSRLHFEFLILDEAQRIKNDESVLSQVLRKFKTKHRILLTGTPLQNNLKELWALLNFLMPRLFDSAEEFKELFMIKNDDDNAQEQIIKQIHRLLRPFMLRRLKIDVEKHLPTKQEIYLFIGLSKMQKTLYKNILSGNIDVVNGIGDKIKLLNVLMQLKKVCNHPYLFDKIEPGPPFIDGEHMIDNSMKFKVLDLLIPKLLDKGCKILIFSQMTRLLDILDDFLRYRGYRYCRIDGQTSANDREIRIEDFQKEDSEKQLFILSTRAGGLGINLHSANVVIIFDSDWNPQVDLQAIDRAHRIGQKRDVTVYRFVTEGSVEEKIVERAARKLKVDHLIMQKGKFNANANDNNPSKINAQEMLSMIKFGAQEIILTEQEGVYTEADIDGIINHSVKRTEEINQQLSKIEDKFNLNNVSLTGEDEKQTNLYTFEGQDYKKKTAAAPLEIDFIDIGQRERKQMSYDIDKYYREALNIPTQSKEKKKLKGWKAQMNGGYDHQFFDNDKLDALEEKEHNWNHFNSNPDYYIKNPEFKQKPPQFTKKDQQQKEQLLKDGFPQWTKKDFFTFIRMCETFGRLNIAKIKEAFQNKTIQEIQDYSEAFWANWEDRIENGQKYIERIEKGEAEIEKYKQIEDAIEQKFQYTFKDFLLSNPLKSLKDFTLSDFNLPRKELPGHKHPFDFTEEEDKFIAMSLYKFGYGSWELIRNNLRNSVLFRLNWVVKMRTVQDIQKRCEHLVQKFKKEVQGIKKLEEEKKQREEELLRLKNKGKDPKSNGKTAALAASKNVSKKNISNSSGKGKVNVIGKRQRKSSSIQNDSSSSDDSGSDASSNEESYNIKKNGKTMSKQPNKSANNNQNKKISKQIAKSSMNEIKVQKKNGNTAATTAINDSQSSSSNVRRSSRRHQ